MRFRPLSRDPFTDIGRTIPEFRSVGLAESEEFHGFSVDKKNVFEIDGEAARFLFEYAPKHVDMFSCNPAAYEQHHEIFSANASVDSAAHCGLSVQSFHSSRFLKGFEALDLSNTSGQAQLLNSRLTPQQPIGFPRLPCVPFSRRRFSAGAVTL
jgi:hypothetical protein